MALTTSPVKAEVTWPSPTSSAMVGGETSPGFHHVITHDDREDVTWPSARHELRRWSLGNHHVTSYGWKEDVTCPSPRHQLRREGRRHLSFTTSPTMGGGGGGGEGDVTWSSPRHHSRWQGRCHVALTMTPVKAGVTWSSPAMVGGETSPGPHHVTS